jgi:MSHA pilin protein MshA
VLAAVALPRFVDLRGNAVTAATQGIAGSLSSASAINFGARSINAANTATYAVTAAGGCLAVTNNLQDALPTGYTPSGTAPTCTLTNTTVTPNVTAAYTAILIN